MSVVGAIAPQLERAEIERAKRKPTGNLSAYDYYLRGMANLHLGTREAIHEALSLFDQAIRLDPDFASAYAMAAWCHFWRKVNGWMIDRPRETAEGPIGAPAVALGRDDAVASREAATRSPISPATLKAASLCSTEPSCSIQTWRLPGFSVDF